MLSQLMTYGKVPKSNQLTGFLSERLIRSNLIMCQKYVDARPNTPVSWSVAISLHWILEPQICSSMMMMMRYAQIN